MEAVSAVVCCAFIACIVGQILVAVGVLKGALLGRPDRGAHAANPAVVWRLDPTQTPAPALAAPPPGGFLRMGCRGLVLVAALEIVILLGAVYGIRHIGHDAADHAGHDRSIHALHR